MSPAPIRLQLHIPGPGAAVSCPLLCCRRFTSRTVPVGGGRVGGGGSRLQPSPPHHIRRGGIRAPDLAAPCRERRRVDGRGARACGDCGAFYPRGEGETKATEGHTWVFRSPGAVFSASGPVLEAVMSLMCAAARSGHAESGCFGPSLSIRCVD